VSSAAWSGCGVSARSKSHDRAGTLRRRLAGHSTSAAAAAAAPAAARGVAGLRRLDGTGLGTGNGLGS
jgi:hypothetical protein